MKKNVILNTLSVFLILVSLFATVGAITVTGSGFLDLSNIVRAACICTAVACLILAVFAWNPPRRNFNNIIYRFSVLKGQ